MQLPRLLLFFTFPLFRRLFARFMKIISSRFFSLGKRQQLALPSVDKEEVVQAVEKRFQKKALLIGIREVRENDVPITPKTPMTPRRKAKWKLKRKVVDKLDVLKGPHRDVEAMKDLLIETYSYDPTDITVLIDDDDPEHIQPTRENILEAISNLVAGARENDRFFFHFAGHSTQEDTDDIEEEDRMDEFLVTSDGQTIKDDELRLCLVQPLPPKSSLIAIFDSCHSGSLLDLKHFRCNQVYVPWLNRGDRRTNSLWYTNQRRQAKFSTRSIQQVARLNNILFRWKRTSIDQLLMSPEDAKEDAAPGEPLISKKKTSLAIVTDCLPEISWFDSPTDMHLRCSSPEMLYCSGTCRDNPLFQRDGENQPDVISLSSAGDGEKSWESADGTSMTQVLVQILKNDPHPSLHNLLTLVSHDLHTFYLTLHIKAREYRKRIQVVNKERIKKGKKPFQGDSVEMNNFQNPQLSSDRPLDMSRTWYP